MSGVVKSIKKVFKKVIKFVKKAAPIILAAAAIYFTAGAALGAGGAAGGGAAAAGGTAGGAAAGGAAAGAAGGAAAGAGATATGWGAAAAKITSAFGINAAGTLGKVVTGAITQAGYGAAIGGVISKATGGSFTQGAQAGAITGAISGGLLGGFKPPIANTQVPAAGAGTTATTAGTAGAGTSATGLSEFVPSVSRISPTTGGGGLLRQAFGQGGWVERNQTLAGNIVSGIGQGLLSASQGDAEKEYLRERQRIVDENYRGVDPGAGFRQLAPGTSGQSPTERFDPRRYGSWEYSYDPKQGRIVRVPIGNGG